MPDEPAAPEPGPEPGPRAKILAHMASGMGRALACQQAGCGNYRHFTRLMAQDADFRDEVFLIERCREELAEVNIYGVLCENPGDIKAAQAYLSVRWRVREMNEARAARRRSAALEERKIALLERKVAAGEGKSEDEGRELDLSVLTDAELATWNALARKIVGDDPGLPAPSI